MNVSWVFRCAVTYQRWKVNWGSEGTIPMSVAFMDNALWAFNNGPFNQRLLPTLYHVYAIHNMIYSCWDFQRQTIIDREICIQRS